MGFDRAVRAPGFRLCYRNSPCSLFPPIQPLRPGLERHSLHHLGHHRTQFGIRHCLSADHGPSVQVMTPPVALLASVEIGPKSALEALGHNTG